MRRKDDKMPATLELEQSPRLEVRTYQELVTVGAQIRSDADGCDWTLGDLCLELQDLITLSKKRVQDAKSIKESPDPEDLEIVTKAKELQKKYSKEIGVSNDYLEARRRVSARIPKGGNLSWIRDSSLSFTHCRALYPIKDDATLDKLANKALAQNLTVEQLRDEVAVVNDVERVEQGSYTCGLETCGRKIEDASTMFAVRRGKMNTLICSPTCLLQYAQDRIDDENETNEPETEEEDEVPQSGDVLDFMEDLDDSGTDLTTLI